jgi:hypothetical protein
LPGASKGTGKSLNLNGGSLFHSLFLGTGGRECFFRFQQLFLLLFSEKEEEFAVLLYVGVVAHQVAYCSEWNRSFYFTLISANRAKLGPKLNSRNFPSQILFPKLSAAHSAVEGRCL